MERTAIPAGAKFEALGFEDGKGFVPVFSAAPVLPPAREDGGEAKTVSESGVSIRHNTEHDGVEIRFPGKPAAAVLTELKAAGFRWSRFSQVWYKKMGAYSWAQAHRIAGIELPADGGPGRNEGEDPAGAMVQANEEAGQDQVARDIGA